MPLPLPPSSSSSSPARPAWFSLSRWTGGRQAPPSAARGRTPAGAEADVEQLRTQARRRLIGAVVLLAVGVVAFPLVFETEPRPMGVDTPMQRVQGTVSGAAAPELPPPAKREDPAAPSPEPQTIAAAAPAEPPAPSDATPPAAPAAEPQPALAAPSAGGQAVAAKEAPTVATAPAPAPAPATADREQAQRAEAQRARALLEGRSAAAPAVAPAPAAPVVAARYVVQVGAFTEKRALAEARSRVERLGLKTYTQVIDSPAGPRTRVRVGPFDSRAEADAAGARLRAAGLQAAILTL